MDYKRVVEAVEAEAEKSLAAYADEDDAYCAGFRDGVEALTRVVAEAREREERKREIAESKGADLLRKYVGARFELLDEVEDSLGRPWTVARDGDGLAFTTVRECMGCEPMDRSVAEEVAARWLGEHSGEVDRVVRFDLMSFTVTSPDAGGTAMVRYHFDCLGGAE